MVYFLDSLTYVRSHVMRQDGSRARDGERHALETASPNERPTVLPPFDPAAFARDSETQLSTVPGPESSAPTGRGYARERTSEVRAIVSSGPELEESAIGNLCDALGDGTVPVLLASPDELGWLDLPPEAARLLGHIDGVSSLDAVCSRANVASEDGALILLELAELGIVMFR